ncbi:MAG: ABC transporter permease subunit, partial [Chthonomonadales bacterium]
RMLSLSVSNSTDYHDINVPPVYLTDDDRLFAKYADEKYSGDLDLINAIYQTNFPKMEQVKLSGNALSAEQKKAVEIWRDAQKDLPQDYFIGAFRGYGTHPSGLGRKYRAWARDRFKDDIRALNTLYIEEHNSFQSPAPPPERTTKRNWSPDSSPKMTEYMTWRNALPEEWRIAVSPDQLFASYLKEDIPAYHGDWKLAAKTWGLKAGFAEVTLSNHPPDQPEQRADWEAFVRSRIPFRYVRVRPDAAGAYRKYMSTKYVQIAKLNRAYGSEFTSFDQINLPRHIPYAGQQNVDWGEWLKVCPLNKLELDNPAEKYRALASAAGLPGQLALHPPYHLSDTSEVLAKKGEIRVGFMTRNYAIVIDYVLLHGRALWVTALFCLMVIATTLTVNPLCAYALSRFNLPSGNKILLFLLATMAFPAEVAMIPNFLMLKQLGFLNTYWALVLPGAASGFSIFLLKGFFDSLPKELFEAGTMEGASEARMFTLIAVPLSKPIFAVIALQAFTGAYGAFMFALVVCQDPKMWTIMVWLYELQFQNPTYIMMAGMAVAAIPTLLVFVFAQKVIMRGIILPTEK